jgi:hypothetical protein
MAQQSARLGRKNQMYSSCLEHAFMIWFRSANSHTGPQLHRSIRGRTDGSIRLRANLLQKPLALGGASTDEYTAFCNGPDEVKSSSYRHAAELTLLSVVDAKAATLCC